MSALADTSRKRPQHFESSNVQNAKHAKVNTGNLFQPFKKYHPSIVSEERTPYQPQTARSTPNGANLTKSPRRQNWPCSQGGRGCILSLPPNHKDSS